MKRSSKNIKKKQHIALFLDKYVHGDVRQRGSEYVAYSIHNRITNNFYAIVLVCIIKKTEEILVIKS
jgi:hypothetical protein